MTVGDVFCYPTVMERFGKLVQFTIVGLLISAAVYGVLVYGVLDRLDTSMVESSDSAVGISLLVLLPFALLVGSTITGYLSQPFIAGWHLIFIAPGLYFSLVFFIANIFLGEMSLSTAMQLALLIWFGASLAGTTAGFFIRTRRQAQVPPSS